MAKKPWTSLEFGLNNANDELRYRIVSVEEYKSKSINLEKVLVGLTGVVQLSHFTGQDFETPLVVVDAFEPVEEAKD